MGTLILEMSWGRRVILVVVAAVGSTLFVLALSVAFARPAGASTPPLPVAPTLSAPAAPSDLGALIRTASGAVASEASAPLPSPLPMARVPQLPLPELPVVPRAVTQPTTSPGPPTATPTGGVFPGTGAPARASTATHSGPSARRTGSPDRGSGDASIIKGQGSPGPLPAPRLPAPSVPLLPSSAGDASTPGHAGDPWNVVPVTILLLAALCLGGVFLTRRLAPKLLFDSRYSPPG